MLELSLQTCLCFIEPGFLNLHFSGAIKTLPLSGVWLYIAIGGLQTFSDVVLRMSGPVKTGCGKHSNREAHSSTCRLFWGCLLQERASSPAKGCGGNERYVSNNSVLVSGTEKHNL
jgi:hypothetical protein